MSSFKNALFIILLVGLFIEVLIIFPRQLSEKKKNELQPNNQESLVSGPQQAMQGVHLVESQNGSRDWELFASKAIGSKEQAKWTLQEIKVNFYNNESIDFIVTAQSGILDQKTKDMKLEGRVIITSNNGYIFETEIAEYTASQRMIWCPDRIDMKGPVDQDSSGFKVSGTQMRVDIEKSQMKVLSKVIAQKKFSDERELTLKADSGEFSGKNKQAQFYGQVRMNYEGMQVEGPAASFLQSKDGALLSQINFSGGVKTSDKTKFATSEKLNLDLLKNQYVFTGQPKVYQNDDELSGEQIVFIDGGKKVKVEKIRARVENEYE
jgi:LPS export ABC transporter protein LptC